MGDSGHNETDCVTSKRLHHENETTYWRAGSRDRATVLLELPAVDENQEEAVAYRDLREFVQKLEKEGELRRIRAEVDPVLEITEVAQRVMRSKEGGQAGIPVPPGDNPALLFEKPKGSRYPLLINAVGNVRRMTLAFSVGYIV